MATHGVLKAHRDLIKRNEVPPLDTELVHDPTVFIEHP
jgi:hypothetical protein